MARADLLLGIVESASRGDRARFRRTVRDACKVAPRVRIINPPACDQDRVFDRTPSAAARLIDWLAWKHHLPFVVSGCGNQTPMVTLPLVAGLAPSAAPRSSP